MVRCRDGGTTEGGRGPGGWRKGEVMEGEKGGNVYCDLKRGTSDALNDYMEPK